MDENSASGKSVGVVVSLKGSVQAVSESGTRELARESQLFQGEKLVTRDNGQVEVKFLDDTTLSLGKNSEVTIDAYVYDAENASNSNLLLQMGKGVFRTVTGEIAKQNPDNFNLQSPLALIGIRGTTVLGEVDPENEKWGVEEFSENELGREQVLVVRDQFGNIQFITEPQMIVDFFANQPIQPARPLRPEELDYFKQNTPISAMDDTDTDEVTEEEDTEETDEEEVEESEEDSGEETEDEYSEESIGETDDLSGEEGMDTLDFSSEPEVLGVIDYSYPDNPMFYEADDAGEGEDEEPEPDIEPEPELEQELEPEAVPESEPDPGSDPDPENEVPVAFDDAKSTGEKAALESAVPSASDVDGTVVSYQLVEGVGTGNGTLTFNEDGSYSFDPGTAFAELSEGDSREVTFTYTAMDNDGGVSEVKTVTITVTGTNDVPVAFDDAKSTGEKAALESAVPPASDVDGTVVSYQLVEGVGTGNGTLTFNEDGSYSFDPGTDFAKLSEGDSREVTFTYTAMDNDGGVSDVKTVTITVTGTNDVPEAFDDAKVTGQYNVLSSRVPAATDVDGTVVSYQLVDDVSEGSLTFASDGRYSFDPGTAFDDLSEGDSREVVFTYTATDNDGGVSEVKTVTITIEPDLIIEGTDGDDILNGLSGNDTIYGFGGDDVLYGGAGDDYLYGGPGNDILMGGPGNDYLDGGDGFDIATYEDDPFDPYDNSGIWVSWDSELNGFTVFDGYGDTDTLKNINFIIGSDGDDAFMTGPGSDTFTGNGGDDTFWFTTPDSVDMITDFTVSASENDVLRFGEVLGLGFEAKANPDNPSYTPASNLSVKDPTQYKIIGVIDTAENNWSNVANVINSAVDAGKGDGTDDGTYFVISNGTDSRVYFWEGDSYEPSNDVVNDEELRHFVELKEFTDIPGLQEEHFIIDAGDQGGAH
jgi:VCBS repeat-containing protein